TTGIAVPVRVGRLADRTGLAVAGLLVRQRRGLAGLVVGSVVALGSFLRLVGTGGRGDGFGFARTITAGREGHCAVGGDVARRGGERRVIDEAQRNGCTDCRRAAGGGCL